MTVPGPFRSAKVLRHAKGQPCTLRFPGICNGGGETTVACHIRDAHKGMGQKASDHSIVFGCAACHRYLDEQTWRRLLTEADVNYHVIAALQETWAILIRDGIIVFPHDVHREPKPRARKPKADRKAIPHRDTEWPSREMTSRQFSLSRKERP